MTTHRNLTTFLAFIVTLAGCIRGGEFPVTDFGDVGDGVTDCTEAFGKAIKASSRHGGKVVVPDGEYLCRTIHLLDNTMDCLSSPISVSIRDGVNADDLTVKGLKATGIYGTLSPIVKWNDNGFRSICTDKIDVDS